MLTACDLRHRAKQVEEAYADTKSAAMLNAAADEIDRLRRERDDLVSFLGGIGRQAENMARSYENK